MINFRKIATDGLFPEPKINEVLPPSELFETSISNEELENYKQLPEINNEGELIGLIVQTVLRASFYLALIALVAAGIYYLISQGNEDDTRKAKNIILYLAVGFIIIASAYGIVSGVIQFNPF